MTNADKLVSISGSKRLLALAKADYDVPDTLIDYYRTLTQTLERVCTNAQVAAYGLRQQTLPTSLKVMGAIGGRLPFPGTSVLSSLLVVGIQQSIEVQTTRELKKILACFGDSTDFLEVTNEVAKKVCIGKQKYLEAYKEDEALQERAHRAAYQGREVASPFMLVNLFKKAVRSVGMDHTRNLSDSPLRRKAIDDVGTLVDAMIGMSEVEAKIMLQDRVRWMTAKLGVVNEEQKPAAAVAGPSHREATAVSTEMGVRQMNRDRAMQRKVSEFEEIHKLHAREIAILKQNLPLQDGVVIVAGRGGAEGNQAQMQLHRQADPFASPEGARLQRRNAVLEDQANHHALEIQALKESFARQNGQSASQG